MPVGCIGGVERNVQRCDGVQGEGGRADLLSCSLVGIFREIVGVRRWFGGSVGLCVSYVRVQPGGSSSGRVAVWQARWKGRGGGGMWE